MMKKPTTSKDAADKLVKSIRRKTRQTYSAEEKIRIILAGLRGEESISVLCRREGIAESLYYSWSKEFLEARETFGIPQTDSTGFASQAGLAGRLSFRGPAHAQSRSAGSN